MTTNDELIERCARAGFETWHPGPPRAWSDTTQAYRDGWARVAKAVLAEAASTPAPDEARNSYSTDFQALLDAVARKLGPDATYERIDEIADAALNFVENHHGVRCPHNECPSSFVGEDSERDMVAHYLRAHLPASPVPPAPDEARDELRQRLHSACDRADADCDSGLGVLTTDEIRELTLPLAEAASSPAAEQARDVCCIDCGKPIPATHSSYWGPEGQRHANCANYA